MSNAIRNVVRKQTARFRGTNRLTLSRPHFDKASDGDWTHANRQEVAACPRTVQPSRTRVLRVLVVDDNPDFAESSAVLLRMWGHDARVAFSGKVALEAATGFPPHVFLLDIAMPRMSGYELARHCRARFRASLLVAITGYADAVHRALGEQAGFDRYLAKPVDLAALEALLLFELDRVSSPPDGGAETTDRRDTE
ncbi:response regulator [Limnoglobus roseus]|uniref:Response regulator n=1 Tax=Limnoglobus roseus TaxID=2598579 RepID=A0A5C1AQ41_9BACT|nr:response regulator [Limnoglobus roseus]QEL19882.1 response regulator [Limnoglobus roseus]